MTYLSRREASKYLADRGFPVAYTTLQKYASVGGGPLYRTFGGRALYLPAELDEWAEARMSEPRTSTSDAA